MEGFEYEIGVAADFIGNNWAAFTSFYQEFEISEPRAEELMNELEKAAGRS